ncbi:TOBE domain-containing protein [Nocardioides sp. BYT-33-1]|uniref:TOBE domain-containing protein n=1 Tax=Nocardioides sp. BYT-33-1 TaxID=3416952 RepID=UPI003F535A44
MVAGRFLQVAAPAEVYLSPADPRVAGFIGHASLLPGEVTPEGRGRCALGDLALRTATGDRTPPGPARFAVRSEQLQVRAPAESADGTSGEVVDVSFFGHDATIRVRLGSGEQVTARTPAGSVPLPGDRVQVTVVGDVLAFPGAASDVPERL